ncbi:aromatic ring-hydroxylating dioxygenase subunit alpha [Bradyrhizobium sp. CCBAU 53421]|uniref:aromatic ring-hydroxylating oxygenase subunit alpha n=1 Tax=Bradyrhizobium sp. CCBAU 53421 TaxID=1325120 RepID=UPI00188D6F4C|nr:aromatic ring-hydroxylating dioxygenase subunit alpha [Bradyrhizobium sp. CCBAU 53421]QOZ36533.1 hypothetical protein XH92_37165 [Bradyrhizobium sp. CCBAU 53421]
MNSAQASLLANTRADFERASTMPGFCYTSAEWYEREVESIFTKEWICVGREEQVPNPGDYFRFDIVGEPLVVVRDGKGIVRVHSAVCRHRGAVLGRGKGKCRTFICPYHSWTYALSGELVSVPGSPDPMDHAAGFDPKNYGLISHRTELWGGFIFVNFDRDAKPLLEWLGDLPELVRNYGLANMRLTHSHVKTIECNWKIYFENSMENYHVATVHTKHLVGKATVAEFPKTTGPYFPLFVPAGITAFSDLPVIETLSEREASGTYHLLVQPNLQLILTSSYLYYRQYLPQGPNKLALVHNWCFPENTTKRPGFAEVAASYYERYEAVLQEDMDVAPLVQQGQRSRFCTPGRYADEEILIHRFANYVIDKVNAK